MLNKENLKNYIVDQWRNNILPSLSAYIKIPNKSPDFDKKWQEHGYMDKAVTHIETWCKAHAPKSASIEIIRIEGRTPLLFIEIPGAIDKTVLLYGHLDKQPEMTGWQEGLSPWEPIIKNDCLYGRGAADDGYAVYASLTAINALQAQALGHARCIILIEACEESGSYDLPYYVETLKSQIAKPDLIICLDSGAGNYEQLWMTTSLRGNVVGELTVELLKEGVHSGNASGIVADSFRVARQLISRIENEKTGEISLDAFYCEIPPKRIEQAAQCAVALQKEVYECFPFQKNVEPINYDCQELILNRTWRPALAVTGAAGLPAIADAGNVLRPQTSLKLSLRLPPLIEPKTAAALLEQTLTANPPYQAKVNFNIRDEAGGWNAPEMVPWLSEAIEAASQAFYQKSAMYMGEGGTIPFMQMLGELFPQAQFMITGILGPHSNAHGPNEFLHLKMVEKLTACVSYVLHQHFNHHKLDNENKY